MPCAGTRSWRRLLQEMNPTLPGQLLQVKEAVTGHPQAGTCKAETLSHPSPVPLPLPQPALLWLDEPLSTLGAGEFHRAHREFRCQKGQPGARPWL